jgi:hypothetical protein
MVARACRGAGGVKRKKTNPVRTPGKGWEHIMKLSKSSIARTRRFFKGLKDATALPNPLESYEGYLRLRNEDLPGMDKPTLRQERHRVEFMLMLIGDKDPIITVTPEGELLTARAWLMWRLELINRALREAV